MQSFAPAYSMSEEKENVIIPQTIPYYNKGTIYIGRYTTPSTVFKS